MVNFVTAFSVFSNILGLSMFKETSTCKRRVLHALFFVGLIIQCFLACFVAAQGYYALKDGATFTGVLIESQSPLRAVMGIIIAIACFWNQKKTATLYQSIRSAVRSSASEKMEVCDKVLVKSFVINIIMFLHFMMASMGTEAQGNFSSPDSALKPLALESDFLLENRAVLAFILCTWMGFHRLYFALFAITFSSLCQLLKMNCAQYNANLKTELSSNPQFFEEKIVQFRRQFASISSYVDQLSAIFKCFLALWISYCVLSVFTYEKCLNSDIMSGGFKSFLHFGFLILNELYAFYVIHKEATLLNLEARKTSQYLTDSVSEESSKPAPNSHLMLFSQRLNQGEIGVSVGNYAILNRNFILLIYGIIVAFTMLFMVASK